VLAGWSALDRVIERADGPVVLAGHAYAGAVIAGARGDKVRSLVYVAALAPDEGETVADVFYRADPDPHAPVLAPDRHGLTWLPRDAFASAFAQNATGEDQALLNAVQRPIAAAAIGAPVTRPLWRDRPSWFLVAEQDRMIVAETQRFMVQRMGATVRAHPLDHAPMLTAPDDVVAILLEAANDVV
jgi:hypothetical protein